MPTTRCPQCADAVQPGQDFCRGCGYPLFWDQADGDVPAEQPSTHPEATSPPDVQPAAVEPSPPSIPAPQPQPEPSTEPPPTAAASPTAPPAPAAAPPVRPSAPAAQPEQAPTAAAPAPAPPTVPGQVRCRVCGHDNPEERVLCQRCGSELRPAEAPAPSRPAPSMRRGSRWLAVGLLAVVLALGVLGAARWLWTPPDDPQPPRPELRVGSTGDDVRSWQEQLTHVGHRVDVDGAFGSSTEQATRAFQTEEGLPASGVVDQATWEAMDRRIDASEPLPAP